MTNSTMQVITAIKLILQNRIYEWDENTKWQEIYDVSKIHKVDSVIAYVISQNKNVPKSVLETFSKKWSVALFKYCTQEAEAKILFDEFERNGIDFMPLKGVFSKNLYPIPAMRNMCDVDILIKEKQYQDIDKIMQKLGYSFNTESQHELIYTKKPAMDIELHKSLVPNYNKDLYKFFGDGWNFARKIDGKFEREMKYEDFYIYNISHIAKHYLIADCDIKDVLDIYLINKEKQRQGCDNEYIESQLQKIGLTEFAKNLLSLSLCWFENAEYTDITKEMENCIIGDTIKGKEKIEEITTLYRESGSNVGGFSKILQLTKKVFLPYKYMVLKYPIIKKYKILYPFVAIHRIFGVLINKHSKIAGEINNVGVSTDEVKEFAKHCKNMGLKHTL